MQKQQFLCQLVYQHYFASRSPHKKRRTRQDPERMVVGVPVVVMIIIYPDPDRERHLLLYNILELAIFITYIYIYICTVYALLCNTDHAVMPMAQKWILAPPGLVLWDCPGLKIPKHFTVEGCGRNWHTLANKIQGLFSQLRLDFCWCSGVASQCVILRP